MTFPVKCTAVVERSCIHWGRLWFVEVLGWVSSFSSIFYSLGFKINSVHSFHSWSAVLIYNCNIICFCLISLRSVFATDFLKGFYYFVLFLFQFATNFTVDLLNLYTPSILFAFFPLPSMASHSHLNFFISHNWICLVHNCCPEMYFLYCLGHLMVSLLNKWI